jgi:hypothetical protein
MIEQANIIDRADTLREAAGDLAAEYRAEGEEYTADLVEKLFGELPDESAARLLTILEDVFGVKRPIGTILGATENVGSCEA